MAEKGRLRIQCFKGDTYIPVEGTKIIVTSEGTVTTRGTINNKFNGRIRNY